PVTFTSSSATGSFAPGATVTIPAGASSATVTYSDTHAGSVTLGAAPPGQAAASQVVSVRAAALASLTVAPKSASVAAGRTATFTATGADAYGNSIAVVPSWTLSARV